MVDSGKKVSQSSAGQGTATAAISLVQRGNLKSLEQALRKQWRLGQNIVLCWSADPRGVLVIFVPHYFLGNYCAPGESEAGDPGANETFIQDLISGQRRKTREELFAVAQRLDVAPTFVRLETALDEQASVLAEVEQLIRRYGLSFVNSRAVLLFDITQFSLYTPFEQSSQLNSLSYSLNSAYTKLQAQGIEVNFARTTTGDGYYVWNRDLRADANRGLFYFMALVVADNAVAQAASRGNTVPVIRTAFHIGSHYELYQAEGVNPTVFSYIVGDVTIELARMVAMASSDQILIGDFTCSLYDDLPDSPNPAKEVTAAEFVESCNRGLAAIDGLQLSSKRLESFACKLSDNGQGGAATAPWRFEITDKHGLRRDSFNLEISIDLEGQQLGFGILGAELPPGTQRPENPVAEDC